MIMSIISDDWTANAVGRRLPGLLCDPISHDLRFEHSVSFVSIKCNDLAIADGLPPYVRLE